MPLTLLLFALSFFFSLCLSKTVLIGHTWLSNSIRISFNRIGKSTRPRWLKNWAFESVITWSSMRLKGASRTKPSGLNPFEASSEPRWQATPLPSEWPQTKTLVCGPSRAFGQEFFAHYPDFKVTLPVLYHSHSVVVKCYNTISNRLHSFSIIRVSPNLLN